MDLKDQLKNLSERILRLKDQISTEEGTKNAFIMPFIQMLGYDVFNPVEVVPEYISDIGLKKGEKVDYAIMKDGHPIILMECKHWNEKLQVHDSQLLRYFHTSKAKFSILTNGIIYRFYTDLVAANRMDEKPFLEINMVDIKDNQIEELKKFHKSYFDVDNIVSTASELKYMSELKALLTSEMSNPSEQFVRLLTKQIYSGIVTAKVLDQFTSLIKNSFTQLVNDLITERLKSALKKESDSTVPKQDNVAPTTDETKRENKIVTTEEEIESFFIIKSIIRSKIASERLSYRDAQSYFAVLFDDNNRKPICRLYLDGKRKMIGLFDEQRKEHKVEISNLDEIYNHAENLLNTVMMYLQD
jgi:predicted type IV restriction endonuclease